MEYLLPFISLVLFALAMICKAVMDTLRHHWYKSIFNDIKRFDLTWWYPKIADDNKYKEDGTLRYKFPFAWLANFLDAWHVFQMIMFILIVAACYSMYYFGFVVNWWVHLILIYVAINGTFELFYKKILIKKIRAL